MMQAMPGLAILEAPVFSDLCNLAFALRREVFVVEQHVPEAEEFDARDLAATHLVGVADGSVCSTLRILWLDQHAQYSRFVVRKALRGTGIGTRMLGAAMRMAEARGVTRGYLEAQADKIAFYRRFGFREFGDAFLDGGMPHLKMKTY